MLREIRNFGGICLAGALAYWIRGAEIASFVAFIGLAFEIASVLHDRREQTPSRFTPTSKEVHEMLEAAAKRRMAELAQTTEEINQHTAIIRLHLTQREAKQKTRDQKIQMYYEEIQKLDEDGKNKHGAMSGLGFVTAGPEDDPQLVQAAWNRFKKEREIRSAGKWEER